MFKDVRAREASKENMHGASSVFPGVPSTRPQPVRGRLGWDGDSALIQEISTGWDGLSRDGCLNICGSTVRRSLAAEACLNEARLYVLLAYFLPHLLQLLCDALSR